MFFRPSSTQNSALYNVHNNVFRKKMFTNCFFWCLVSGGQTRKQYTCIRGNFSRKTIRVFQTELFLKNDAKNFGSLKRFETSNFGQFFQNPEQT